MEIKAPSVSNKTVPERQRLEQDNKNNLQLWMIY